MDRPPDLTDLFQSRWFRAPEGDRYLQGQYFGVAALLLMTALVTLTWIKLPYHRWKKIHEWFGLVVLLIIAHVVIVDGDIAPYPVPGIWMWGFFCQLSSDLFIFRLLLCGPSPMVSSLIIQFKVLGVIDDQIISRTSISFKG